MKILVMGGTRFVGRRLVSRLLDDGMDVTLLTRGLTSDPFGQRVRRLQADRTDPKALGLAVSNEQFDLVYDQICYQPEQAQQACQIFAGKTGRYIFTSSMYVYSSGARLQERDFDAAVFNSPTKRPLPYDDGKRACEKIFALEAPFPVTCVRFPIIVGHDDYTGRLGFHLDHLFKYEPIYVPLPSGKMNYLSAEEAGRFLNWLKDHPMEGAVNAASPEPLTAEDVIAKVSGYMDLTVKILRDAPKGTPASPYYRSEDQWMDVTLAQKAGFAFESFSDGLFNELRPLLTTARAS